MTYELKEDDFIHMHVHDEYSNLRLKDSTNRLDSMIKYVANTLNQKGFAITNHDCMSNHVKFINNVKGLKAKGEIPQDFKYILGNEIYLLEENEMNEQLENKKYVPFYHFILLALDKVGHRQLRELSSRAWERSFSYKGMDRVPTFNSDIEDVIGQDKGHIVASTACLGSRFSKLTLQYARMELCLEQGFYIDTFTKEKVEVGEQEAKLTIDNLREEIDIFLSWCLDMFDTNFYIELQPSNQEDQIMYNKLAFRIAKAYNIPTIITTDAHFLTENDKSIHKAFLKSDEDDEAYSSGGREVDGFYDTTYFMSSDELHQKMEYLGVEFINTCINNTYGIYEQVEQYDLGMNQIVPQIPIPQKGEWVHREIFLNEVYNNGRDYESIIELMQSPNEYDNYLVYLIDQGMVERNISINDYVEVLERVNVECKEIIGISKAKDMVLSSYFITMHKFLDIIWNEADSLVGVSRGSGAGFIINYLLQIVQINPLKQPVEMPHWRFISADRPDCADIDIDVCSHKRDIVLKMVKEYFNSFGGDVVRVGTFKTETSKSAMQTACRGMGLSSDVGTYLSSLIPITRGRVHSIREVYYGDETKGIQRVTEFVNQIDLYEGLFDLAVGIENIISGRGVHPCGVISSLDLLQHTAVMKAPNGELITQCDLSDVEYCGGLKFDFLNTLLMSMMQITLEMLIEHNYITWQGSLRETYNKYLHPDIYDYNNVEYYNALNSDKLIGAFQFDSPVGSVALKTIKPTNLLETANANSLMRLMTDGESPMDKYVRYKNNPQEWYNDMKNYGLNQDEINIVREHFDKDCGVCSSQEGMMLITMDERVANFNVVESNKLRKGVAKGKKELIAQAKELLFERGLKNGTSDNLLHYIWDEQIAMQLGYGFSVLHTIGYSHILLQQLELITNYPPIYWNTAVLLVKSGAISQEVENEEDNKKEKTTNYGVVASAISTLQDKGVKISLPDINVAKVGFIPYEEENAIMFGLKGITSINNDVAQIIMDNRPYTSLVDFHERLVEVKREVTLKTGKTQNKSLVTIGQTINLIKAGAFDSVEIKPREQLLEEYLLMLNPHKKVLTMANVNSVIELGIVPSEFKEQISLFHFRKYINSLNKYKDANSTTIEWVIIECFGDDEMTDYTTNYLLNNFPELQEGKEYIYGDDGNIHVAIGTPRKGSFEALYKEKMSTFTKWLNSKECVDLYNHITFSRVKQDIMYGDISHWEMSAMNYYYSGHELAKVDKDLYSVVNFHDLPEEPTVVGFTNFKGVQRPKFQLSRIAGTVLDRNKTKHTISLLTEHGVVPVKFYSGQFSFYDKTISVMNEDGSKSKIEESFFKRGTRLLVTGFRNNGQFRAKKYANSIYQHTLSLITDIREDGTLDLQNERAQI